MKTKKRTAASSRPEKLVVMSAEDIRQYAKSPQFKKDSAALASVRDKDIDFSDIPELTEEQLARMQRPKQLLTIRLDADIVDWLKSQKGPYQTRLNAILRLAMQRSSS